MISVITVIIYYTLVLLAVQNLCHIMYYIYRAQESHNVDDLLYK